MTGPISVEAAPKELRAPELIFEQKDRVVDFAPIISYGSGGGMFGVAVEEGSFRYVVPRSYLEGAEIFNTTRRTFDRYQYIFLSSLDGDGGEFRLGRLIGESWGLSKFASSFDVFGGITFKVGRQDMDNFHQGYAAINFNFGGMLYFNRPNPSVKRGFISGLSFQGSVGPGHEFASEDAGFYTDWDLTGRAFAGMQF